MPPRVRWPLVAATALVCACGTSGSGDAASTDKGPTDGDDTSDVGDTDGEPSGPRWLAGDLHLHSSWSTDALDNPVDVVIEVAEDRGMDYFVFTDHDNHVDGDVKTWDDPLYVSDEMVMLYGVEYTTARGHANLFAPTPWDHLRLWALRDDQGDGSVITDEVDALGVHLSVNHPANDDPWEFSFDLPYDSMEIWNAVWTIPARNDEAVAKWDELLQTGRRIPGRGGSDVHHQEGFEAGLLNVGNPTTWIYADERTPEAILAGLEAGHVTISYAPGAERLELRAAADDDETFEAMMGDNLDADETVTLELEIVGFRPDAEYRLVIFAGGTETATISPDEAVTHFNAPLTGEPTYFRAELHGDVPLAPDGSAAVYGDMVAMTNPIYVGYD